MENYIGMNMTREEEFENLTLANNFMFGEVMYDEQTSKDALEIILGVEIRKVVLLEKEKAADNIPGRKSIRMDIYVKDDENTVYNIEMQVEKKQDLPYRSRYYQAILDTKCLPAGALDYRVLNPTYIIFICQFDPFDENRCYYTFEERCVENLELSANNGCKKIFLNTKGSNREEIPKALGEFLDYIQDPQHTVLQDDRIKAMDQRVKSIKHSAEVRDRYMTLMEWLNDEVDRKVRIVVEEVESKVRGEVREEVRGEVREEVRGEVQKEERMVGQWMCCITHIRKQQTLPQAELVPLLAELYEEDIEAITKLYQMVLEFPELSAEQLAYRYMEECTIIKK